MNKNYEILDRIANGHYIEDYLLSQEDFIDFFKDLKIRVYLLKCSTDDLLF